MGSTSRPSRKATPAQAARTPTPRNLGKITAPTLQRVFGNERLFARLDAARFYPVVWLHGPPGAGKTTLAASYLAARGVKPLWCRLDEGESDPASVFLHLAEAARQCAPGLDLPLLQPEFRTALPLFTRRFFRTLFGADGVSTMVLDDYHEVAAGAELHDCLPAGIEEVPAECQLIIISRSAPPSQLARLRLNGKVDVIEPDALRLNAGEIRGLAKERGADMPGHAEERIVGATQGWAAGVILMLEASAPCPVDTNPATPPLPEVLFDYFAGEILQRMEPWAPAVLSTLALMPTMTSTTAERLTGHPEAGAVLEELHRRNYFTTRDSAAEPRYRFHPLFRDFLRSPARKQGKDETLLKMRAAAVLDEDGQADAAAQLLAEAGQAEALAGLIKRRAKSLLDEGRTDTLRAWLAKLGNARIASDAWLSYWRGAACVVVDPIAAHPHFMTSLAMFESSDDVTGQFVAWAGAAEAVRLDAFGDSSRFDPLVVKMHRLLKRHPAFPSPMLELSVSYAMASAVSRRSAERAEYERWKTRTYAAVAVIGVPEHAIRIGFAFAIMDLLDGNFAAAADDLEGLPDPFALDHLPLAQWAGLQAHLLALVHRQRAGDIETFVVEALKRFDQSGLTMWMPVQAASAALFAFAINDVAACDKWRLQAAALADKARGARGSMSYVAACGHKLLIGDLAGAKAEADKGIEVAAKHGYHYFMAQARLMRANALFAAAAWDDLAGELDRLDAVLAGSMSDSLALPAMLLRAALHFKRGDATAGRAALVSAMTYGRHPRAVIVIMYPKAASFACKQCLDLDIEPDFVRTQIRLSGLKSPDLYDEAWPWPIRITTFGGFAIAIDGEPLTFSGKTPRRLISLVKAIATYGGRAVPEAKIADAVWPDEEADAAFSALRIAIHRLRKLLGDNDAIVVSNGTIGFDPTRCWLDLWAFEHKLDRRRPEEAQDAFDARIGKGLALYRGDFLPDDDDIWWTTERRDALRKRYQRALAMA